MLFLEVGNPFVALTILLQIWEYMKLVDFIFEHVQWHMKMQMFSWHHQKVAAKFGLDLEIWWETSHCVVALDLGSLKALLWFIPDLCFLGCPGPRVLASLACYVLREGLMSPSWFRIRLLLSNSICCSFLSHCFCFASKYVYHNK